jgi:hypothetical protein
MKPTTVAEHLVTAISTDARRPSVRIFRGEIFNVFERTCSDIVITMLKTPEKKIKKIWY